MNRKSANEEKKIVKQRKSDNITETQKGRSILDYLHRHLQNVHKKGPQTFFLAISKCKRK